MTPVLNEYYQHKYGGLYLVSDVATHTTTKERLVIYIHVYPFEESVHARPIDEWTDDRFTRIDYSKVEELLHRDRLEFQIEIGKARAQDR